MSQADRPVHCPCDHSSVSSVEPLGSEVFCCYKRAPTSSPLLMSRRCEVILTHAKVIPCDSDVQRSLEPPITVWKVYCRSWLRLRDSCNLLISIVILCTKVELKSKVPRTVGGLGLDFWLTPLRTDTIENRSGKPSKIAEDQHESTLKFHSIISSFLHHFFIIFHHFPWFFWAPKIIPYPLVN